MTRRGKKDRRNKVRAKKGKVFQFEIEAVERGTSWLPTVRKKNIGTCQNLRKCNNSN